MKAEYLVTGGLGFIGSAYVRQLAANGSSVAVVDALTYAANVARLEGLRAIEVIKMDVASSDFLDLISSTRPRVIVHMAAESHVTRSEDAAEVFFRTNVEGTERVMEAARLSSPELVVHVSTDEVYGPCEGDPFKEDDKQPGEGLATSAYARSKAIADDVALSYSAEVPVVVVRPTNCFGPWQHPEKAIPRWIIRGLSRQRLPVWGDGRQVRDWMHVDDACSALALLTRSGSPGEAYNIAPEGPPVSNIDLAASIAALAGMDSSSVYLTAYDRPDHDRRYAIDSSKLQALGWHAEGNLSGRLKETVEWYARHAAWWAGLREEAEALYDDAAEQPR